MCINQIQNAYFFIFLNMPNDMNLKSVNFFDTDE